MEAADASRPSVTCPGIAPQLSQLIGEGELNDATHDKPRCSLSKSVQAEPVRIRRRDTFTRTGT